MNNKHRKVLEAIFAHPISANIDFKDVEHLLQDLGAEIENKHGARIGVSLNGHQAAFHHANHSIPKEEVIQIKKFLEACGVVPA
jgi:hypothetical protein